MPCECDDGCERRCSLRGRDAVGRTGMAKVMAPSEDAVTGGLLVDPTTQSGFVADRRCCARADVRRRCGSPVDHAIPGGGCGSGRCRVPRSAALRIGGRLGGRRSTSQAGEGARCPAPRSAAGHTPPGVDPVPAFIGTTTPISDGPRVPRQLRSRHRRTLVGCRDRGGRSVTVESDDVLTTSGRRLSVDRLTDRHRVGGRIRPT